MAREEWTDKHLDDLNKRVGDGFEEMRREFTTVRSEIREEIRGVRREMTDIRTELGALNRTIHQFLFAIVGTIFLGFMGTIAALFSVAT